MFILHWAYVSHRHYSADLYCMLRYGEQKIRQAYPNYSNIEGEKLYPKMKYHYSVTFLIYYHIQYTTSEINKSEEYSCMQPNQTPDHANVIFNYVSSYTLEEKGY